MASKSYVLTADVWYRPEQGEDIEPVRYGKGAVLDDLTDNEVKRLKRQGAIAEASSTEGKAAAESPAPTLDGITETPQPSPYQQSEYLTARANSGLGPDDATGGELSEDQWEEETAIDDAQAAAIRAAQGAGGAGNVVGATQESARPAKSATTDEWRRWAVQSHKKTADQAETMNKGELQALK